MNQAPCKDCGKDTEPMSLAGEPVFERWDFYIVRDEVWAEAGMNEWFSGFLCTPCLRKRLGRPLTDQDYLVRHGFEPGELVATPEYGNRVLHGRGY